MFNFSQVVNIVIQMAEILNIDVEEMIEKLTQSDQTSKQLLAMLRALDEFNDNDQNNNKTVICQIAA